MEPADEPVPKIPYSRGFRLSGKQMIRIAMIGAMLALVIMFQKPCADSVSKFVTSFDDGTGSDPAAAMPRPGNVSAPSEPKGVRIDVNASPEEQKAAIEKARQQSP